MKIKVKLLLMVGVPVAALLIITALGVLSFNRIEKTITHVDKLHVDRAAMNAADRDAYQAQMAVVASEHAHDGKNLGKYKKDCLDNMGQTWTRITGPSKHFTPEMGKDFASFKSSFKVWKDASLGVLKITSKTLQINKERKAAEARAIASFDAMREVIDKLGELASANGGQFGHQALESILSADRDAYQAYTALMLLSRAATRKDVDDQSKAYADNAEQARSRVVSGAESLGDEATDLKDDFLNKFNSWNIQAKLYVKLTSDAFSDNVRRKALIVESDKAFATMRSTIDKLGEGQSRMVEQNIKHLHSIISTTIYTYLAVALLSILAALGIALLFSARISKALQDSAAAAAQIIHGDFDVNLQAKGKDETAQLQDALNSMAATLRDNIAEINAKSAEAESKADEAQKATAKAEEAMRKAEVAKKEGMLDAAERLELIVERVATAAEQLSQQGVALRNGSDFQAERIQGTATAMEEMNVTVLEIAQNASQAADEGVEAKSQATDGSEIVDRSIQAMTTSVNEVGTLKDNMGKLDEQAKGIGAIIGVINDIADQTNLLALNAAIEAARAGEAGRGFAVVADEVRKLAEKTMDATQEVSGSVSAIQNVASDNIGAMENVYSSITQANDYSLQSGEMLKSIVAASENSADQIQSIATAAEEQSATSEEINRSIDEINQVTLENARGVNESTMALDDLAEQMSKLKNVVNQLKTEGEA